MAAKDKQVKQKFGLIPILFTFVVLTIFGVLGEFIGLFQASIVGLIITLSAFILLRIKARSKSLTNNEKLVSSGAFLISIFLVMDVLTFGFIYSQGGYTPQLLNVSFPTAKQASSIFNTSLIITSSPYSFGNAGTGQSRIFANAEEDYRLKSNSSYIYVTLLVFKYGNNTDAKKAYAGWINFPFSNITGDYNGLSYTVFGRSAAGYLNNYLIVITASQHINQTSTINLLKKETDIINENS